jgi:hypothetical protein
VENYVRRAEEYVENANNDIKRIKDAAQDVISKSNEAVDEYNAWLRRCYEPVRCYTVD